ncbi:MAG: nucleotide exchange factor GrpE [Pyrinomonadaceae bacterium]|nr:nucleotide exchange factor GrpE [Pyrinomonadaceae bacterium]
MNPKNNHDNAEDFSDEVEIDESASIDDFIRELEAREKDLHISPETVIEIEDDDFDSETITAFLEGETAIEEIAFEKPAPKPAAKAAEPKPQGKTASDGKLDSEIAKLKAKIANMEKERTEVFELSRRRQLDFDNFKKRTERDRDEIFSSQLGNLTSEILPVIDNLERALNSVTTSNVEKSPDFKQFFDGIVLVDRQLNEIISEMGVKPIKAVGEVFDPHFHEAVATEETTDHESNIIIDEFLRGFQIGEKVLRPSMVKVAKKSPKSGSLPLTEIENE